MVLILHKSCLWCLWQISSLTRLLRQPKLCEFLLFSEVTSHITIYLRSEIQMYCTMQIAPCSSTSSGKKPWKETMRRGRYSWGGGHCPLQWVPPWSGLPGISTTCSIFCPRSSDWELFSKANDWSVKKQTDKSRHEDDPAKQNVSLVCFDLCVSSQQLLSLSVSVSCVCATW